MASKKKIVARRRTANETREPAAFRIRGADGTLQDVPPPDRSWEAAPAGEELMHDLEQLAQRWTNAARGGGAAPTVIAAARILRALMLALRLNSPGLTKKPKTKQSPHAWAKAFLRKPSADTKERIRAFATFLWKLGINPKTHNFDSILEGHEAVKRFLRRSGKALKRPGRARHGLTAEEDRAAMLVLVAEECFPRLFPDGTPSGEELIALAKRVATKIDAHMDGEAVMRATLVACGMSKDEARALTNFMDH